MYECLYIHIYICIICMYENNVKLAVVAKKNSLPTLPMYMYTACPTSSVIFQSYLQSSKLKLVGLFCHVSVKRDPRASAPGFASTFGKCPCKVG